jgi:hypothetical protein
MKHSIRLFLDADAPLVLHGEVNKTRRLLLPLLPFLAGLALLAAILWSR